MIGESGIADAATVGEDYRYRLYGSRIAERAGFDLTGKLTRDVPTHPAIGLLFRVCYRACAARRLPLFTRHVPPANIGVVYWSRIVLPLANEKGEARHFLVGNVPGKGHPAQRSRFRRADRSAHSHPRGDL